MRSSIRWVVLDALEHFRAVLNETKMTATIYNQCISGITFRYRLDHDIEQIEYLVEVLNKTDRAKSALLASEVLPRFRRVRARVPPIEHLERTFGLWGFRPADTADLGDWYNRALHMPDPKPVAKMLGAGFSDP